jgi:ribosomal protein S18 acetylase RimI-like enzyme
MHSSLLQKLVNERCSPSLPCSNSPTSSCPSTPPCSTTWFEPPQIDFCVMNNEHRKNVSELVIDTFFRDEPLSKCLAFDVPTEPTEFVELVLSIALEDQCSFVAIDIQTQKIIGVTLNIVKHRLPITIDNPDKFDINNFQSEKLRFVLGVLQHVHRNIDLFQEMNTDHLLHIVIIAIDPHYRGLRLTEKLIHASLERAKTEYHLKAVFAEATSLYSAKAFRKQGFQLYDEIIYIKYDDVRLATLAGEHDRCQLLAKQL